MPKILCVLCGGEIGNGWPAICLPKGFAHRFRTECDGLNPITQEAIDFLQRDELEGLGYTFTAADAVEKAGERILHASIANK